jgi:hypothetical protein
MTQDTESRTYPFECELCHHTIESEDDQMWWHGYGNCVEITDEMWEQWKREAIAAGVDDYGTSGRSDK